MLWLVFLPIVLLSIAVLVLARQVAPLRAKSPDSSARAVVSSSLDASRSSPSGRERFDQPVASFIQHGDWLAVPHPDDPELALVFGAQNQHLGSVIGSVPVQLAEVAVGANALVQAGISMGEQAGMLVRLTQNRPDGSRNSSRSRTPRVP